MQIIPCTPHDVPQLAAMNKRLIEDEKSDNPMDLAQLEDRMRGFLSGEYAAFFFRDAGEVVGYALVRRTASPLYLRQFYIDRAFRRRHYGREAFFALMDHLRAETIDVDVLPWNRAGMLFWQSLGFEEICVSMRYKG